MELSPEQQLHGFTVQSAQDLPEINGRAFVLSHDKSKARVLYLQNDDNNKAFSIAFRTPPQNDTGVFHILEHSVLCGSKKFPVKEPFVDLLKGSMQTFLNAMTFPDKTMYPVASTNEQDLMNLADVYLDAVFHPNIYRKRAIFEQEGWHYELSAKNPALEGENKANVPLMGPTDTTLAYNGVVFNEMKGALSDASSVLLNELQFALFPDTPYAFESGGTPEAIPTLTYEDYLDDHARHYRLSNSYTVLYGNLDIDRMLGFLDGEYFSPVADEEAQAAAERAAAGLEPLVPRTLAYADARVTDTVKKTMDTAPENACAGAAYVLGTTADRTRVVAADILIDALFGSNEAPMKRALLDEGIGEDVSAFVADGMLQPFAVVTMRKPLVEDPALALRAALEKHLARLIDEGLDKEIIEAALTHSEFVMREHNFGYPEGVLHAISSMSGWLYDDDAPVDYIRYEDTFAELRANLEGDYFDQLARSIFLENNHRASAEIIPTPGRPDNDQSAELAGKNFSLTAEERALIVAEEQVLRELQMQPDSPESIATLPRLSLSDLGDAPVFDSAIVDDTHACTCLRHSVATYGLVYANRYYQANCLAFEDMPYLHILSMMLGKLGTSAHTAAEIDTLTQGKLGNLDFKVSVSGNCNDINDVRPYLVVSTSALAENAEWMATLVNEVLLSSDLGDVAKIKDVLQQIRIAMEQRFANAGHACALKRVASYYSPVGVMAETLEGVDFYRFIVDLLENFDDRSADLTARLERIAGQVMGDNLCTISFGGADDDFDRFWAASPMLGRTGSTEEQLVIPEPVAKNEAFIVPTDVTYTALGYDNRLLDVKTNGSWLVASRALSYDYLWNEIRVKGGAYGAGFQARLYGETRFYTYRDPHVDESIARFADSVKWLQGFEPSEDEITGYIISTVASIDEPKKPRQIVMREDIDYLQKRDPNHYLTSRAEVIATDADTVRALAATLEKTVDKHLICAFGNRDVLYKSKAGLRLIDLLNE